jgi:hypothetical protein
LLGCYRTGDANDPEVYVAAVFAVLSDYPLDIVTAVTDPRTGIASKLKWLPTIAEVKAACEAIAEPRRRHAEWQARSAAQIAERDRASASQAEHTRVTAGFDDLLAYLRRDHVKNLDQFTPEAVKAKFGLTDEQWDALEDAPPDSTWHKLNHDCAR